MTTTAADGGGTAGVPGATRVPAGRAPVVPGAAEEAGTPGAVAGWAGLDDPAAGAVDGADAAGGGVLFGDDDAGGEAGVGVCPCGAVDTRKTAIAAKRTTPLPRR